MCVSGGNAGGGERKRKEEPLGPTQHLLPVAHQEASSMSVIPPSFSDNDGILHKIFLFLRCIDTQLKKKKEIHQRRSAESHMSASA